MPKAKIGVSVGLVAAITYLLGAISVIPLVLVAGYILVAEENEWLKRAALKAITIFLVFAVLSMLGSVFHNIIAIFNTFLAWFPIEFRVRVPLNFDNIIGFTIDIIRNIVLLIFAMVAFSKGPSKNDFLDKSLSKHM